MTQAIVSRAPARNALFMIAAGGVLTGLLTPLMPALIGGIAVKKLGLFALIGVFVLVEIGDDYVRALAGEGDRHRLADAAVGAGHYRGLPGQAARSPVAGFAVIWYRVHLLLGAWRVLLLCWLAHRVVPP